MDSSSSINRSTTTTTTTTTTTSSSSSNSSELFICFNTRRRLTTRISARPSILSPAREPQISLSTCRSISRSRSRRLRTSGSTTRNRNGRSSPMFPGAAKRRGSGFDNPEPSSPKVTCIGQVRVKSKKKGIKLRTLPRRQSGEVSFRTLDQIQRQSSYNNTQFQHSRNQRWVHLPVSICESFNCLIPCKSLCVCENDKDDKKEVINKEVVVQQNLERDEEMERLSMRSTRRHVFDKIEIKDEGFKANDRDDEEEKNVNIPPKNALLLMRCRSDPVKMNKEKNVNVPPKNALLLMRCRSDPVKMEALVNRCWEPQLPKQVEDDDEEELEEGVINKHFNVKKVEMVDTENLKVSPKQENQEEDEKRLVVKDEEDEESEEEDEDDDEIEAKENKNEDESRVSYSNASFSLQSDDDISEADDDQEIDTVDLNAQKMAHVKILEEEKMIHEQEIQENIVEKVVITKTEETEELETEYHAKAILEKDTEVKKEGRERSKLPDCLLLMMCEPKLSMEVSKETWVCNKDFAEEEGRVPGAKSSCTFPASMAAMIEHKLLNAAAYEPFVLTRCKSAPIRAAGAVQLAPDGWFWKTGGLEKHQRGGGGGFRVGAAELVRFQLSR